MPYPPTDGEAIAIWQLTAGLAAAGCSLTLLTMNTPKHSSELHQLPPYMTQVAHIEVVWVDTTIRAAAALRNLFSQQSYHIARFDSMAYRQRLIHLLQNNTYDIIQLEGVYLASYLPLLRQYSTARVVMRTHNVEYEIWERLAAEQALWSLRRWYMQLLARRLRRFELHCLPQYDAMVPISDKDGQFWQAQGATQAMLTIAAGIDLSAYQVSHLTPAPYSVFFIGSLDWLPNLQGLEWLLTHVWQAVLQQCPQAVLHIAGRNCPPHFAQRLRQTAGVAYCGAVADARQFMSQHSVMLVPLFSGSGMRVKIIEGMAMGKAIVATSIAAEGVAYTHQQHLLIADTANDFCQQLCRCLNQPDLVQQLGSEARLLVAQQYDQQLLSQRLVRFYEKILAN